MRNVPQGAGAMYAAGQPVYYQGGNVAQGYVYPQQMMSSMPRGWQAQYPVPAGYSNPVGVVPRGNPSASRGGRGASRGAAGAARGGSRRNQAPVPVEAAIPPAEALTLAQVKQFPAEQQKVLIGERLYGLIAIAQPQLAGKITGMFLESGWSVEELFALLGDEASLNAKIADAIAVLQQAQQPEAEGSA